MKRLKQTLQNRFMIGLVVTAGIYAPGAKSAVITPELNNFTLANSSADGSVAILTPGPAFTLIGGNTGSGIPGNTNFTITSSTSGVVQFTYSYSSLDDPGFDSGGYILGTTETLLANADGAAGSGSFTIAAGQTYGWYVNTMDNTGEPGVLTVNFPSAPSTVPEPSLFLLTLTGIACAILTRSRRFRFSMQGGNQ